MSFDLARRTHEQDPMTRLDTIATRQRKSFVRDAMFATLVAIAAVISLTTVGSAVHGANTHLVQR